MSRYDDWQATTADDRDGIPADALLRAEIRWSSRTAARLVDCDVCTCGYFPRELDAAGRCGGCR